MHNTGVIETVFPLKHLPPYQVFLFAFLFFCIHSCRPPGPPALCVGRELHPGPRQPGYEAVNSHTCTTSPVLPALWQFHLPLRFVITSVSKGARPQQQIADKLLF